MKMQMLLKLGRVLIFGISFIFFIVLGESGAVINAAEHSSKPYIKSILVRGTNVVIKVFVPSGYKKITIEGRGRLDKGAWVPRAVTRTDGNGGEVDITLPVSDKIEMLRVRSDVKDILPESFYSGQTNFEGSISSTPYNDMFVIAPLDANKEADNELVENRSREVEESDIWKFSGNRLFFFNQLRGLQVIDVTEPEHPSLIAQYKLPAVGEQMYVLSTNYVILLAHITQPGGVLDQVIVLDAGQTNIGQVGQITLSGRISESRLVGDVLYVATTGYKQSNLAGETIWKWGTELASIDFSDPSKPVVRDTLWFDGYNSVISANSRYFFLSLKADNWQQPDTLKVIDITDPTGVMKVASSITVAGSINDKFKINESGNILSVISEVYIPNGWLTVLETFSLSHSEKPERLAIKKIALGERLFATRFDSNKVYVVTFRIIDPLWIIDLSDPSNPQITGELKVPGWSTYIAPFGDKLVTIGIADERDRSPAVSLFDVSKPSSPQLICKVTIGDGWTWSEATYDEKAFKIIPESGLILVPYQSWNSNGLASAIQLIDLDLNSNDTNALKRRGIIRHEFQPRRAAVIDKTILSISATELLSVDFRDRDDPKVVSELELAWPVNKVLVYNNYLIQISDGLVRYYGTYNDRSDSVIRISSVTDPNMVIQKYKLSPCSLPIVGATINDNALYVVQSGSGKENLLLINQEDPPVPSIETNNFCLTVFDLSRLPELVPVGFLETKLQDSFSGNVEMLWVKTNVLVLANYMPNFYPYYGLLSLRYFVPWYNQQDNFRFYAFEISSNKEPRLISELTVPFETDANSLRYAVRSSAFVTNNLLYFSYSVMHSVLVQVSETNKQVGLLIREVPVFKRNDYLCVIDYSDPETPTLRKPVSIPGELVGISYSGELLLTRGYCFTNNFVDCRMRIDACAYDGVNVSLVDSLWLSTIDSLYCLSGTNVFIMYRSNSTNSDSYIEAWQFDAAGKFNKKSNASLPSAPYSSRVINDILAVVCDDTSILAYDFSDIMLLRCVGKDSISLYYYWPSLDNAIGSLSTGLWIPMDLYGVYALKIQK